MGMKEKLQRNLGWVILAFHLIGVAGTLFGPTSELTISLTPLNLLLSAGLIFFTHAEPIKPLALFALISFVIGFSFEVVGVATGVIFGEYQYGPTLGWSWMNVPLVIGVNWFILSYCFAEIAGRLPLPFISRSFVGAVFMVLLDFLIEPVAVKLDYWQWTSGTIPIQNFIGWFVIALVIQFIANRVLGPIRNTLTIYLIISQIIYFSLILIFY